MVISAKLSEKDRSIICRELQEAIGVEKVKDDEVVLITYSSDPPTPYRKPSLVVLPENKEDVKATLMLANKHKIPVTPVLRGVNNTGYTVPSEGGILLDLRRMNKRVVFVKE